MPNIDVGAVAEDVKDNVLLLNARAPEFVLPPIIPVTAVEALLIVILFPVNLPPATLIEYPQLIPIVAPVLVPLILIILLQMFLVPADVTPPNALIPVQVVDPARLVKVIELLEIESTGCEGVFVDEVKNIEPEAAFLSMLTILFLYVFTPVVVEF